MSRRLAVAIAVFVVGVLADAASTYVAVSTGRFVEGSPVGRYFVARYGLVSGMALTKLAGMVVIAVPVAIARRDRNLVLTLMLFGVGLLSLFAAARNLLLVAGFWPL